MVMEKPKTLVTAQSCYNGHVSSKHSPCLLYRHNGFSRQDNCAEYVDTTRSLTQILASLAAALLYYHTQQTHDALSVHCVPG